MELEELQQLIGELRSLELGSLNAEHSKDEDDDEELGALMLPALLKRIRSSSASPRNRASASSMRSRSC